MPTLERAIEIAHFAHEGQFRFNGEPYINHPLKVMNILKLLGYSEATQQLGVLHDSPEDSKGRVTLDSLANEGFKDDVLIPLDLMTKEPGEDYDIYIARICTHARARAGKRVDLFTNMDLTGVENPTRKMILNVEKYGRALVYIARFPQPIV
jgi:(p)ppGpp synthase/HD superfamily hydrolase